MPKQIVPTSDHNYLLFTLENRPNKFVKSSESKQRVATFCCAQIPRAPSLARTPQIPRDSNLLPEIQPAGCLPEEGKGSIKTYPPTGNVPRIIFHLRKKETNKKKKTKGNLGQIPLQRQEWR